MSSNEPIIATLNTGGRLPFRPTVGKSHRPYFAILKPRVDGPGYDPGRWGVKVDQCVIGAAELPSSVKVGESTLHAVDDVTQSGNPKVIFMGPVKVNGKVRTMSLNISKLPSGDFNISGRISGDAKQGDQQERARTERGPLTSL